MRFEGFEPVGVDVPVPVGVDALAALEDLAAEAAAEGLAWRRPPALPPTASAHLLGEVADRQALGSAWRTACYRALWERGEDLGDRDVLQRLAEAVGVDRGGGDAVLGDRVALAAVRRRMARARREGVGGVPVLLVHRTLVPGLLDDDDLRALARSSG